MAGWRSAIPAIAPARPGRLAVRRPCPLPNDRRCRIADGPFISCGSTLASKGSWRLPACAVTTAKAKPRGGTASGIEMHRFNALSHDGWQGVECHLICHSIGR